MGTLVPVEVVGVLVGTQEGGGVKEKTAEVALIVGGGEDSVMFDGQVSEHYKPVVEGCRIATLVTHEETLVDRGDVVGG